MAGQGMRDIPSKMLNTDGSPCAPTEGPPDSLPVDERPIPTAVSSTWTKCPTCPLYLDLLPPERSKKHVQICKVVSGSRSGGRQGPEDVEEAKRVATIANAPFSFAVKRGAAEMWLALVPLIPADPSIWSRTQHLHALSVAEKFSRDSLMKRSMWPTDGLLTVPLASMITSVADALLAIDPATVAAPAPFVPAQGVVSPPPSARPSKDGRHDLYGADDTTSPIFCPTDGKHLSIWIGRFPTPRPRVPYQIPGEVDRESLLFGFLAEAADLRFTSSKSAWSVIDQRSAHFTSADPVAFAKWRRTAQFNTILIFASSPIDPATISAPVILTIVVRMREVYIDVFGPSHPLHAILSTLQHEFIPRWEMAYRARIQATLSTVGVVSVVEYAIGKLILERIDLTFRTWQLNMTRMLERSLAKASTEFPVASKTAGAVRCATLAEFQTVEQLSTSFASHPDPMREAMVIHELESAIRSPFAGFYPSMSTPSLFITPSPALMAAGGSLPLSPLGQSPHSTPGTVSVKDGSVIHSRSPREPKRSRTEGRGDATRELLYLAEGSEAPGWLVSWRDNPTTGKNFFQWAKEEPRLYDIRKPGDSKRTVCFTELRHNACRAPDTDECVRLRVHMHIDGTGKVRYRTAEQVAVAAAARPRGPTPAAGGSVARS